MRTTKENVAQPCVEPGGGLLAFVKLGSRFAWAPAFVFRSHSSTFRFYHIPNLLTPDLGVNIVERKNRLKRVCHAWHARPLLQSAFVRQLQR